MLVTGKAEKPRGFKGVKSLSCQYKFQIFSDYARRLDTKFYVEGRKVSPVIDNCPAHLNVDYLKAIELVFLPHNKTSKT